MNKATSRALLVCTLIFAAFFVSANALADVVCESSWEIHQGDQLAATDLHFKIYTDTEILDYTITVEIVGDCPGGQNFDSEQFTVVDDDPSAGWTTIECDFWRSDLITGEGLIPFCCHVRITARLVLPFENDIFIREIDWTFEETPEPPFGPGLLDELPDNGWTAIHNTCLPIGTHSFFYHNMDAGRDFEIEEIEFYTTGAGELSVANLWSWSTWDYIPAAPGILAPGTYVELTIPQMVLGDWLYFRAVLDVGGLPDPDTLVEVRGQHQTPEENPTFVEFTGFEAVGHDGYVEVIWTTATELDNAGFNVYRSDAINGKMTKLNDELIAAKGSELMGATYTFKDYVASGDAYYWFEDISLDGKSGFHGPALSSPRKDGTPSIFSLSQNYPNPFNPTTEIRFNLPNDCFVTLEVYNVLGQRVSTLVNEQMTAGSKIAHWSGKDHNGVSVTSGVYFYKLQADNFVEMKKMILMR